MNILKRLVRHQDKIQKGNQFLDLAMVPVSIGLGFWMDGGWSIFWFVMAGVSALMFWLKPAEKIRNLVHRRVARRSAS